MRILVTLAALAGCAAPGPAPAQAHARDSAAIQKLRQRVAQLELQVRAVRAHSERRERQLTAALDRVEKRLSELTGAIAESARPSQSSGREPIYSIPVGGAPFDGPHHAAVTLVVASEFACPYCERAQATLDQLRDEYQKDLKVVYQSFVVHPRARPPARALCAAGKLRRHRPMLEALWRRYREGRAAGDLDQGFSRAAMSALAAELKLPRRRFERAMKSCAAEVAAQRERFVRLGVSGAPTFFINGRRLEGSRPIEQFRALIEAEKAKAERAIRSGVKRSEYYKFLVATGARNHR